MMGSALVRRDRRSNPYHHPPAHKEEAICQPSSRTGSALPAPRTVTSKCLSCRPLSLWDFVTVIHAHQDSPRAPSISREGGRSLRDSCLGKKLRCSIALPAEPHGITPDALPAPWAALLPSVPMTGDFILTFCSPPGLGRPPSLLSFSLCQGIL